VAPGAIREAVIAPMITSGVTALPTIKTRGTIVRKTVPINQAFQKFVDMNLRVRDVLQRAGPTNRVPNNNNGTEMCLLHFVSSEGHLQFKLLSSPGSPRAPASRRPSHHQLVRM
jgi:hypothetical protein